ncbi:hypothetical protein O9929_12295 [Vibrio lentus]|nr:hypothetical protein [Vibrio lentus]
MFTNDRNFCIQSWRIVDIVASILISKQVVRVPKSTIVSTNLVTSPREEAIEHPAASVNTLSKRGTACVIV